MSLAVFFPLLALAFSGAPKRECKEDAYCVLVRETFCGKLSAVALGQDKAWADWEAKERAKAMAEKRVCETKDRMDPRRHEARCENGLCVVKELPAIP